MGSSLEGTRLSQHTTKSLPIFSLYPSAVTKDSKAQHVLGLSRAQLHNARSESLILKVEPRPISYSSPNKLSARKLFTRRKSKAKTTAVEENAHRPLTAEQRISSDRESSLTSPSQAASLKRFPSSSTLRSFYDVATAPLRISQQTSDSSSSDFVLPQTEPEIHPFLDGEMESTKPPKFSKVPQLRSITEDKKLDRDDYQAGSRTITSPISRVSSADDVMKKAPLIARASTLSPPPTPSSPPTYQSRDSYFKISHQPAAKPSPEKTANSKTSDLSWFTPYGKVHVRRPKAGTKHWFDDLEGVSSDEDAAIEPEKRLLEFNEGKIPFRKGHIAYQSLDMDYKEIRRALPAGRKEADLVFELSAADVVPPCELEGSPITKRQSLRKKPDVPQRRRNPLARADLNHDSILHLSDSEDELEREDVEKEMLELKPVESAESTLAVHRSVAIERYDDSNREIGLVRAIKATKNPSRRSPSPIQVTNRSTPNGVSPENPRMQAASISDRADSESALDNESDNRDSEVDALISSFPATPTDTRRPRRASSQSSISFSDERSVASLRLMKVTRQEEYLIAAMREKRAAMKRAEKITAHADAARTHDKEQRITTSTPQVDLGDREKLTVSSIIRLYADESESSDSRPVTTYLATSSEPVATGDVLLVRRSSRPELQDSPVILSNQDRLEKSQLLRVVKHDSTSVRPDSNLSTASGVSQQEVGELIVLDNLDAAAAASSSPPTFPSQLFIESPFEVWKRIDSASLN